MTGTAGEATEGLLAAVREAVDKIAGPYDNILVKSSVTVSQNISVTVTTDTADTDEAVENRIKAILTELLAVRRSRKLNELTLSDINHAIRSGYSGGLHKNIQRGHQRGGLRAGGGCEAGQGQGHHPRRRLRDDRKGVSG